MGGNRQTVAACRDLANLGPPLAVADVPTSQQLGLDGYAELTGDLIRHGLWVMRRGIWFVSAVHGDRELSATPERFDAALRERG